jgi:hypothetical protein
MSLKNPQQLPDTVVDQFVKTQYQKALNETEEIKLKGKEIDHQAEYAKNLLDHQARLTACQPREYRKTIITYALLGGMFLLIFLAFVGTCLYFQKDDFVEFFLKGLSYILVSALSFYFGKKQSPQKSEGIPDAEVVNN